MYSSDTRWIVTVRRTRSRFSPARPASACVSGRGVHFFSEAGMMKPKCLQIMIADPKQQIPELFMQQLADTGCRVMVADTGADVAMQCDMESPDVLILDTQLPDMDTFDLCESIRRENPDSDMIVVILADESEELNQHELEHRIEYVGADYFFIKPLKKRDLSALIEELMEDSTYQGTSNFSSFPTRVSLPTSYGPSTTSE